MREERRTADCNVRERKAPAHDLAGLVARGEVLEEDGPGTEHASAGLDVGIGRQKVEVRSGLCDGRECLEAFRFEYVVGVEDHHEFPGSRPGSRVLRGCDTARRLSY